MHKQFICFVGSQVVVLLVGLTLAVTGHMKAAWLVSVPGMALLMMLWFAWVAVWDSRKKWPNLSLAERATKILTFQR